MSNLVESDEDIIANLMDMFYNLKDNFITGITNQNGSSDIDSFLYHNVCTKLQIYSLVENEKVVSVQWRRFAITKKGISFLAFLDKIQIKAKKLEDQKT